ncbi:MAG: tetratricopeptide (TPR) repeat protein [Paraglaciecola sp.]|jgi:tetratricopeptide (TPR) repeat protein
MLAKTLILQILLTFFVNRNLLQAQNDACSQFLARISKISDNVLIENSEASKDSVKLAKLLLDSIKTDCPRRWELLSAHYKIGQLYEKLDKLKKAIHHYNKIAKVENTMEWELKYTFNRVAILRFTALDNLAKIYLEQGKFKKANHYALCYLVAKRGVIGCGHGFRKWRRELLHLQLSIAFAQDDYNDAHLLMRRFTNTYGVISMKDELLFPLFLKLIASYYTESERQLLLKKAIKSVKDNRIGLVASYDLIRIGIRDDSLKKRMQNYQRGMLELKYLQSAAGRVLKEVLSP